MSRNKARLVAMQSLFQLDTGKDGLEHVMRERALEEGLAERDQLYLERVVNYVMINQEKIDEIIRRYSIDWDLHRLGKVDRSILRLAVGEILFADDIPISVSINEAVRLAKRYGMEHAAKFINGILGKFCREEPGVCSDEDMPVGNAES